MKTILIVILLACALPLQAQDCAKLQKRCDSMQLVIKAQNFRINRVKFYVNICMKNPKQDKFLKGWIRRAVTR